MKPLLFKTTVILFALLNTLPTLAQEKEFDWVNIFGNDTQEGVYDMQMDNSGNIYLFGKYLEQVDFDPGTEVFNLTSAGLADMFVLKLNRNGDFIWATSIGGSGLDNARDMAVDKKGNIYITGTVSGEITFDTDPSTSFTGLIDRDIFVAKLDSNGNLIWVSAIPGVGDNSAMSLTIDEQNNVYTTGQYEGSLDFDPSELTYTLTSAGNTDGFIQKLDSNGNFVWATSFGGTGIDFGKDIIYDGFGNIYTTGNFANTASFDPLDSEFDITSNGESDSYTLKVDTSGTVKWVTRVGGANKDKGISVKTDLLGNVITAGDFEVTADLDPGVEVEQVNSTATTAHFIQKLDSTGNYIWGRSFDGGSSFTSSHVETNTTTDNNILVTGNYTGTVDFDFGLDLLNLISNGDNDIFIQLLDSNGNLIWAQSIGGIGADYAAGVEMDESGNVYLTGGFQELVDFDNGAGMFTEESQGDHDVFILKLSPVNEPVGIKTSNSLSKITVYPNPTRGDFTIDLNDNRENVNINIYDLAGREIGTYENLSGKSFKLHINEKAGIYLVRVRSNKGTYSQKIILIEYQ